MKFKNILLLILTVLLFFFLYKTVHSFILFSIPFAMYDFEYSYDGISFNPYGGNHFGTDELFDGGSFYIKFKVNGSKYNSFHIGADDYIKIASVNDKVFLKRKTYVECQDCDMFVKKLPLTKKINQFNFEIFNMNDNSWFNIISSKNSTNILQFIYLGISLFILVLIISFLLYFKSKFKLITYLYGSLFIIVFLLFIFILFILINLLLQFLFPSSITSIEFSKNGINFDNLDWQVNEGFDIHDKFDLSNDVLPINLYYKFNIQKGLGTDFFIRPNDCVFKIIIDGELFDLGRDVCHMNWEFGNVFNLNSIRKNSEIIIIVEEHGGWTGLDFHLYKPKSELIKFSKYFLLTAVFSIIFYNVKYLFLNHYRKKNFFWNIFHY